MKFNAIGLLSDWHNANGIKLMTRLCDGSSHFPEHKINQSFQDCLDPICTSRHKTEAITD